jgi:hypothetical protein
MKNSSPEDLKEHNIRFVYYSNSYFDSAPDDVEKITGGLSRSADSRTAAPHHAPVRRPKKLLQSPVSHPQTGTQGNRRVPHGGEIYREAFT